MKKKIGPRTLKVNNRRNSACSVPLSWLDWSCWWTGNGLSGNLFILHVPHKDTVDGPIHRVYCRHSDTPRLRMENGELYWLVD